MLFSFYCVVPFASCRGWNSNSGRMKTLNDLLLHSVSTSYSPCSVMINPLREVNIDSDTLFPHTWFFWEFPVLLLWPKYFKNQKNPVRCSFWESYLVSARLISVSNFQQYDYSFSPFLSSIPGPWLSRLGRCRWVFHFWKFSFKERISGGVNWTLEYPFPYYSIGSWSSRLSVYTPFIWILVGPS